MSGAREILCHLKAIGATIEPSGDRLLLRAGLKPIPATFIRRVREVKPELLALLHEQVAAFSVKPDFARVVPASDDEPSLEQPCAARRGRVVELDGAFLHFCVSCGRFAPFGRGVQLRAGRPGRWYCSKHRPCGGSRK